MFYGAIAKHVTTKKLSGMKAHDWHVVMQELLPLCMKGLLQRGPRVAIMRLSRVFRRICAKVVDPDDMHSLKADVAVTMSMLEIHMPPIFFDVMSHLVLHLVEELELCMAKLHVLEKTIGLVAEFMAEKYEPLYRKVWTKEVAAGIIGEVLQSAATTAVITPYMRDIAYEYMLLNYTSFQPLCKYHSNQHA